LMSQGKGCSFNGQGEAIQLSAKSLESDPKEIQKFKKKAPRRRECAWVLRISDFNLLGIS